MVCPKFVLVVPVAARYRSPTIIKILGFKAKSETFFFFFLLQLLINGSGVRLLGFMPCVLRNSLLCVWKAWSS